MQSYRGLSWEIFGLISMVGCEIRSLLAICNMKFRNLKGIVQWSASKVGLFFNCGRFWVQMMMARVFCCLGCYRRTAYDITLVDDHWPQDMFNVVSGNTSQSWERLHAGGLLSHSFELDGKVKGLFLGSPAVITFRIPTKAALQEAYSTPILPLDVLADKPPVQKLEWVSFLLGFQTCKFINLCLDTLLFGFAVNLRWSFFFHFLWDDLWFGQNSAGKEAVG
ncbi:uncharacterized protein LOC7461631 isoform X2 [Populus trichocarpa]|uniref:uncharacterized protein LOC7461631 isoform X2 n=1 Tax=Populus trichocarpa TaxID=3694 RepID=UPI002277AF61|nr:uncharacterized protein LOC7461631 isoform X2 [Populus trichocarpa]